MYEINKTMFFPLFLVYAVLQTSCENDRLQHIRHSDVRCSLINCLKNCHGFCFVIATAQNDTEQWTQRTECWSLFLWFSFVPATFVGTLFWRSLLFISWMYFSSFAHLAHSFVSFFFFFFLFLPLSIQHNDDDDFFGHFFRVHRHRSLLFGDMLPFVNRSSLRRCSVSRIAGTVYALKALISLVSFCLSSSRTDPMEISFSYDYNYRHSWI